MLERVEKWLKILCLLLAALLMYRVVAMAFHGNPLARLRIPSVPSLPVTNAPAATNTAAAKSTNATAKTGTNAASTNVAASKTNDGGTNAVSTNVVAAKTNGPALAQSNSVSMVGTNATNIVASKSTNATNVTTATNLVSGNAPTNAPTNSASTMIVGASGARGARRGGPGGPMEPGKLGPDVPIAIRSRVEKIVASEIFGPIMRPMPMALLGIGDNEAFMRAPNGQTGLMKEGDELGGIKMLRIGTNRVLVDQDGQNKELMIFGGIGSETLMPKKETTNEPTRKQP
jgi:hypothetical protein